VTFRLPEPFRAVVFDLDGTLIDSYAAIHESLNAALAVFGNPAVSLEETRRRVGRGLEVLVGEFLPPADVPEGVRLFRERYAKAGPASTRLLPGADEVTRRLREKGLALAVTSNKPARFSRQLLALLGLADRFAAITGPDDGYPPKPAPHMVFMALAAAGSKASEAFYVGDMPIDVLTARAAGMPVVGVPTGSATREELLAAGPDGFIESLADLMRLIP